jgi:hypothetical protein
LRSALHGTSTAVGLLHRRSKQAEQRHRSSRACLCSCSFFFLSQAAIFVFDLLLVFDGGTACFIGYWPLRLRPTPKGP